MKKLIVAGVILLGFAAPAFASQCPELIKKAEGMVKMMKADDANLVKINEKIKLAKADHEAGKHAESVVAANEALKLLSM